MSAKAGEEQVHLPLGSLAQSAQLLPQELQDLAIWLLEKHWLEVPQLEVVPLEEH